MNIQYHCFDDSFLDDAAALLAARHQRDRAALPELPAAFEQTPAAREAVEAAWRRSSASGTVALHNGEMIGYLFGDITVDTLRGRSAWVRSAGYALAPDQDAELYRDLYAAAAPIWLSQGCFNHYTMISAGDRALLDMWFALGFGMEQVHALRALGENQNEVRADSQLIIRHATSEDRAALADMSDIITRYQTSAPTWAVALPEFIADIRAGYAELLDDPDATVWLAVQHERVLGFHVYMPAEPTNDLLTPEQCIELSVAATRAEDRGRGVSRALAQHGFADAGARGFTFCVTDWRATNLLSSRFWPRQGFRPAVYRLARRIDERIAWANDH